MWYHIIHFIYIRPLCLYYTWFPSSLPALLLQLQSSADRSLEARPEPRSPPLTPQALPLEALALVELLLVVLGPNLLLLRHAFENAQRHGRRGRRVGRQALPDENRAAGHRLGAHLGALHRVAGAERRAKHGLAIRDDAGQVHVHEVACFRRAVGVCRLGFGA